MQGVSEVCEDVSVRCVRILVCEDVRCVSVRMGGRWDMHTCSMKEGVRRGANFVSQHRTMYLRTKL